MFIRILTGLIGIPFVLWILISGSLVMQISGIILGSIAIMEYFRAIEKVYNPMKIFGFFLVIIYFIFLSFWMENYYIYISLVLLLPLIGSVLTYPKYTITDIATTIFGVLYVGLLFGLLVGIRNLDNGLFWVILLFVCTWGSDTSAYFVGKLFGKVKLAPELSPKKTVEGAIGGVIGSSIFVFIYCLIMQGLGQTMFNANQIFIIILVACFAAILSQIGDLAASSIKRNVGAKDFGKIFPGHGGVLDRFDSVLLTTPFIYVIAYLFSVF
ncbi:MAG: hypothetical protein ATN31_03655 [Candidatus Epulonipiscioides saccharophilum]|nr:MAG: hypothetical protein ATN31_03655 [Epulopiscium sp. AS2M-Bin001]